MNCLWSLVREWAIPFRAVAICFVAVFGVTMFNGIVLVSFPDGLRRAGTVDPSW